MLESMEFPKMNGLLKMFFKFKLYEFSRFDAVKTTRKVEEFVRSVNGFQMMYADSYMTREEFRSMFDHTLYDEMRLKLKCDGSFPEVYDKVNKKSRAGN